MATRLGRFVLLLNQWQTVKKVKKLIILRRLELCCVILFVFEVDGLSDWEKRLRFAGS